MRHDGFKCIYQAAADLQVMLGFEFELMNKKKMIFLGLWVCCSDQGSWLAGCSE